MPPLHRDLFSSALIHVRIQMIGRGSPTDMAYIYSLDTEEREKWLEAADTQIVSTIRIKLTLARRGQGGSERSSRLCDYWQLLSESRDGSCVSYCVLEGLCRPDEIGTGWIGGRKGEGFGQDPE